MANSFELATTVASMLPSEQPEKPALPDQQTKALLQCLARQLAVDQRISPRCLVAAIELVQSGAFHHFGAFEVLGMNPGEQFKLVRRLLKEQDLVLEKLEELNSRIEETLRAMAPKAGQSEILQEAGQFDNLTTRAA